jgi:GNAT superfamily N-acetyltransferase
MVDAGMFSDTPQGPSLLVRSAGLDDYSTIRHIQASAIRALTNGLIDEQDALAATATIYSAAYVAELMAKTTYIALLNGDIVATCAWSAGDDRGHAARISALFVLPAFQGRGIAREVVHKVEQDAARHGFDRFSAIVPVELGTFFESMGYATTSFGTSRDVVPGVPLQVAFVRKQQ